MKRQLNEAPTADALLARLRPQEMRLKTDPGGNGGLRGQLPTRGLEELERERFVLTRTDVEIAS